MFLGHPVITKSMNNKKLILKILKLIYFYLFNIFSYYNYIYHMEFQKINFKKGTTIRQLITNKLGEITIISEIDS